MFNHGKVAVPNPYGPIVIRFAPRALECAANVAVCLRSAGAADFDRKSEALTLEETERIFQSPYNDKIKLPRDLREEFEDEKAQSPELSCRVRGEVLPFVRAGQCLVEEVKVDPCETGHVQLGEAVQELRREYDLKVRVVVRMGQRDYRAHYRNVVTELRRIRRKHLGEDIDAALCRLAESEDSGTRRWARNVRSKPHITRQFRQFARYLVEGTLGKRNARST